MRARFVFEFAANTKDKYYANDFVLLKLYQAVKEHIPMEEVSEIVEPAAGDGAIIPYIEKLAEEYDIPTAYYDRDPDIPEIEKADFYKTELEYLPGRLVMTGPPYSGKNWLHFARKAAEIADWVAFISPHSFLDYSHPVPNLELVYQEDLGLQDFSGSKVFGGRDHAVKTAILLYKKIDSYTDDVEDAIEEDFSFRQFKKGDDPKGYDYFVSRQGANAGTVSGYPEFFSSIGIRVNNEDMREDLEAFLDRLKTKYGHLFTKYSPTTKKTINLPRLKSFIRKDLYSFMNESTYFQRGVDPKRAMNIGIRPFHISEIKGYHDFSWNAGPACEEFLQNIYKSRGSIPLDPDIRVGQIPGSNERIYPENPSLPEIAERGYTGIQCGNVYVPFDDDHLRENVHFERGGDPKDSMKIGKARIKEMIRNQLSDMRGMILSDRDWDWEYKNLRGYDAFIIHIADPEMDRQYIGLIPGLFVTGYEWSESVAIEEMENYLSRDPFSLFESIDFTRGKDPKDSMDIGTECRTFHVGSIRYNRGSTTYLDPEMAKRVLVGDDAVYHQYFLATPGSFGGKGFYMDDLQDPGNKYCYIEYQGEIYPVPGKGITESYNFERGKDPKRGMGIGIFGKLQGLAKFLEKELSWNGAKVSVKDNGDLEYVCLPGNSVISEIKEAIEKFGWGGMMKVNIDDGCSRSYPDCLEHYYKISFKTPIKRKYGLIESLDFERGKDPKRTMGVGLKSRAFPIKGIKTPYTGSEFEEGELESYLRAVLTSKLGAFPESVLFKKDPELKRPISSTWNIPELIKMGFSGVIYNDIFVPFDHPELKESIDFERGKDPKRSMGLGTYVIPPVDELLPKEEIAPIYNDWRDYAMSGDKSEAFRKYVEMAIRMKSFSLYDSDIFRAWINKQRGKLKMEEVQDAIRDLGWEGHSSGNEVLMYAKHLLKESYNFHRGQDPLKAMGIGAVRPYPQMTPEEFGDWFEREIIPWIDGDDWDNISDNLFMNDWESDNMLSTCMLDRNFEKELLDDLLKMREYFNDEDYISVVTKAWRGDSNL